MGQLGLKRAGVFCCCWLPRHRCDFSPWPRTLEMGDRDRDCSSFGALVAMALVSHAAAQPADRAISIVVGQIVHLTAVAAWIGVLLHLFAARRHLLVPSAAPLLAEIVRRFSPFALAATSLLALTGTLAAWRFLQTTGALFTSAYGLTLLVKLALLAPALAAGFVNFRYIRPALAGGDRARGARSGIAPFRRRRQLLERDPPAPRTFWAAARTGSDGWGARHRRGRRARLDFTAGRRPERVAPHARTNPCALLTPHWPRTQPCVRQLDAAGRFLARPDRR